MRKEKNENNPMSNKFIDLHSDETENCCHIVMRGDEKTFQSQSELYICSSANYNYVSDVIINVIFMQNPLIYDFICPISGRCVYFCRESHKLTGQLINNRQRRPFSAHIK